MRVTAVQVEPGTLPVLATSASRGLCIAVALALLSGCAWMPFRHGSKEGKANDCNKPQLYEQAASRPPLAIPAGLDAVNTRGALRLPLTELSARYHPEVAAALRQADITLAAAA